MPFYNDGSLTNKNKQSKQYDNFEASVLFCNHCQQAMPLRKKTLLYLTDGTMYQYTCARCGSSLGTKTERGGD